MIKLRYKPPKSKIGERLDKRFFKIIVLIVSVSLLFFSTGYLIRSCDKNTDKKTSIPVYQQKKTNCLETDENREEQNKAIRENM